MNTEKRIQIVEQDRDRLLAENRALRQVAQAVVDWYENAGDADPDQKSTGSVELWTQARTALKGAA